ncbi:MULTISPECIES: hypothetical protein [unclassified Streptomyces]|uniref:hypothetical protein n=1 Tax=unclassified Streptomyces TaxID=2593676 RepID=UPI00081B8103|nr:MULTISPECIES: hypothetical protein [unclassified Streptomyces]MYQ49963.1 hypothetical protein [Streptomyces sp. SID4941]SCD30896.1 hypothetical protein GA0115247_10233 [Streptomyces sp. PalvLS-984]SDE44229.1 hypothetical protein F558DRAFT_06251 [Streptomyces sp. AmelKG-A3]
MNSAARTQLIDSIAQLEDHQAHIVQEVAAQIQGSTDARDAYALIANCDEAQLRQIRNIVDSMLRPMVELINPQSALVSNSFSAEFRARLQAHHGTHTTPLDRLAFENALAASCAAEGMIVEMAPSKTTRFWDLRVDGEQISAKSTSAKDIKLHELHISKLSEGAWIQDCRSARMRYDGTMTLLEAFLAAVQRWIVLRAYRLRSEPDTLIYELIEVPMALFAAIEHLGVQHFSSDSPRIDVHDEQGKTLQLLLDRSDSKVTINKIPKDRCIVHGTWKLEGVSSGPLIRG